MKKALKVGYRLLNIAVYIIVFMIIIATVPRLFGIKTYTVLSGSMTPTIPIGSIIYDKKIDFNDINVGDVITFKAGDSEDGIVTHRVVAKDENSKSFTTKGDANASEDQGQVKYEDVIGKYNFHIPFIGRFLMTLKESKAYIFIALFIIISIFI
ncbi:signal peptidase I [Clostridium tarantellae]|uniref:Signal peptidase I n=1 Tax=Clostridium tarantellae TaxID=39493 RepID=A0A6I1MPB2_9CLOT|nr:signal peptidase I [Clostridium tarantellae]MPQ44308.1 signal peptidase I [Clostridium tarantellae]